MRQLKYLVIALFYCLSIDCYCMQGDTITIGVLYYDENPNSMMKPDTYLQEALTAYEKTQPIKIIYLKSLQQGEKLKGLIEGLDKIDFLLEVEEGIFKVELRKYRPTDPGWEIKATRDKLGNINYPKDYHYTIDYSIKMINPLSHQFVTSFIGGFTQKHVEKDNLVKVTKLKNGRTNRTVLYDNIPYDRINRDAAARLAKTLYRGAESGLNKVTYVTEVTERDKDKVNKVKLNAFHVLYGFSLQKGREAITWTLKKDGYYKMEKVALIYENDEISLENQVNVGWGKKQLAEALDANKKVYIAGFEEKIFLDENEFGWEPINIGVMVAHPDKIIEDNNLRRLSSNIEYKASKIHSVNIIDRSSIQTLLDIDELYRSGNYEITDKIYNEINATLGIEYLLIVKVLKPNFNGNSYFDRVSLEMSMIDVKTGKVLATDISSVGFTYVNDRYDLTNSAPDLRKLFSESFNWNVEIFQNIDKKKHSKFIVSSRYPLEAGKKYDVFELSEVNVGGKTMSRTRPIGEAKLEDFHSVFSSLMEIKEGKKEVKKVLKENGKIIFKLQPEKEAKGLFGGLTLGVSVIGDILNLNSYEVRRRYF